MELAIHEREPVDLAVERSPDDVFEDAVSGICVALRVQVVADAAGGDFGDEFGSAVDVVVLVVAGSAAARDAQHHVWLGFVGVVEANRGVVGDFYSRRVPRIECEPADESCVGVPVGVVVDVLFHYDHAVD